MWFQNWTMIVYLKCHHSSSVGVHRAKNVIGVGTQICWNEIIMAPSCWFHGKEEEQSDEGEDINWSEFVRHRCQKCERCKLNFLQSVLFHRERWRKNIVVLHESETTPPEILWSNVISMHGSETTQSNKVVVQYDICGDDEIMTRLMRLLLLFEVRWYFEFSTAN